MCILPFVLLLDPTVINVRCKTTYLPIHLSISQFPYCTMRNVVISQTTSAHFKKKKRKKKDKARMTFRAIFIFGNPVIRLFIHAHIYAISYHYPDICDAMTGNECARLQIYFSRLADDAGEAQLRLRFLFRVTFLLSREQARRCAPAT